jgi:hypothetical protein
MFTCENGDMTNTTNTRKPVARAAAKPAARPAAKPAAKAATKTVAAKAAPSKSAAKPAAKSPAKAPAKKVVAAKPATVKAIKPVVEAPKRYKVLTGIDDSEFCARVSAALDGGYELHGAPAATFNGKNVILAQALVLKKLPAKKKAGKKK